MQRAKIRGTTFIIHNHIVYISQFDNVNHSVISYYYFRHPVQKLPSTLLSSDCLSAGEQSSLSSESCVLLFLTTFFFFIFMTNDILALNSDFVKSLCVIRHYTIKRNTSFPNHLVHQLVFHYTAFSPME